MKYRKRMFAISITLMSLFMFFGAFFLIAQSSWGRNKVLSIMTQALQESGWKATVETTQASHINEFILKKISLESPRGDLVTIGSLQIKLSIFRLIKKEIYFSQFNADEIAWVLKSSTETPSLPSSKGIPFLLKWKRLHLSNVHIPNIQHSANISGKIEIGRYYRTLFATLSTSFNDLPDASILATLNVRSNQWTQLKIDLQSPSINALSPVTLPLQANGNIHLYAKGHLNSLIALFSNEPSSGAIIGFVQGHLQVEAIAEPPFNPAFMQGAWKYFSLFEIDPHNEIRFSKVLAKNPNAQINGSFALNQEWQLSQSSLNAAVENIHEYFPEMNANVQMHLEMQQPSQGAITFSSPRFSWETVDIKNISAMLHFEKNNEEWKTDLNLDAQAFNQSWQGRCTGLWNAQNSFQIDLQSPLTHLDGSLTLSPQNLAQGEFHGTFDQLHHFEVPFYGHANCTVRLKIDSSTPLPKQRVEIDTSFDDLFYGDAHIEKALLYANLSGPIRHLAGSAYLEMQHAHWNTLTIEKETIETSGQDQNWPFVLRSEGTWKNPFQAVLNGSWSYEADQLLVHCQNLSGSLFDRPLSIESPMDLSLSREEQNIPDFTVLIGEARIKAGLTRTPQEMNAVLSFHQMPLDFLSINPLNLSVRGQIDLDAKLNESKNKTSGSLNAKIENLEILNFSNEPTLRAESSIALQLKNDRLNWDVSLHKNPDLVFQCIGEIPVHCKTQPFTCEFLKDPSSQITLAYQGKIEEFLDFFDLGAHRLEGTCHCKLNLTHNLQHPTIQGFCHLENGRYENYMSGFTLQNLSIQLAGNDRDLVLRSFHATDGQNKGKLSILGKLDASWNDHFPFEFTGEFSRLNIAEIEWLRAEAGGSFKITGNLHSSHITAQTVILESDLSIPERIPYQKPNLQVKYINAPKPLAAQEPIPSRYPVFLDLHIYAPNGIFISGRGLSSEWKGNFQLGGTYTDIEAKGQLEMMQGEFLFSGNSFRLTEGSLTLSGKPHEIPQMNLAGQITLQDLTIMARLKGPLNSPQLAFQSSPPLPMGSILSQLLFGERISEINAFQAAQLVNSLSTFSTGSNNVWENSRRSLGVDRLRIIATPLGRDGGQSFALQVGKYITRGIMVSVSQGPEGGSTNLMVEVDLTNGLLFQAESQQQLEQGKFSLKWNYNY